jgi:hypothetical protein
LHSLAWAIPSAGGVPKLLLERARAAIDREGRRIVHRDRIGIVDFSRPSRDARFHLVDLAGGSAVTYLVAHGRGSDPTHRGWVESFSNAPGSYATSEGAYLTGGTYTGKHGHSMRLVGLDPQNSNAEPRAIVVHAAWYVGPEIVRAHGKLGRSQGCFAFAERDLSAVLNQLGAGRLILAGKA